MHVREGFHVEVMPELSPKRQIGVRQAKVWGMGGEVGKKCFRQRKLKIMMAYRESMVLFPCG